MPYITNISLSREISIFIFVTAILNQTLPLSEADRPAPAAARASTRCVSTSFGMVECGAGLTGSGLGGGRWTGVEVKCWEGGREGESVTRPSQALLISVRPRGLAVGVA